LGFKGGRRVEFGHWFDLHVAILELPLVILFEQDGADEPDDGLLIGKDADDIAAALDLFIEAFQDVGAMQLGSVLGRKGHVGQHVCLAVVHEGGKFWPSGAELIGDLATGLGGAFLVGLAENLAQGRWCSDALEFTCWNGEVVRVAFTLDCHDREVIGWTAVAGAGISGGDIRDLMIGCVEARFGGPRAPHRMQWLSDNGSIYAAAKTIEVALALNLDPCFTLVESPESNGMAEAFVKTFKRDHVRVNPIPNAATAIAAIEGWITDYNEVHPHCRLGFRSPREYIRATVPTSRLSGLTGGTPVTKSADHRFHQSSGAQVKSSAQNLTH
jgi:hypothetical protein